MANESMFCDSTNVKWKSVTQMVAWLPSLICTDRDKIGGVRNDSLAIIYTSEPKALKAPLVSREGIL